ncbi:MAG: phospholipase [Pirellulales bacterium]|nr:phospholipase [Pirellulales bacterium]
MTEQFLQLSDCDLREIAAALRGNRLSTPITPVGLGRLLAGCVAGAVAGELQQMIEQGFTPSQLATVLALIVKDRWRRPTLDEAIDLVVSGPEAPGLADRDTSVVVRELFAHAEKSVLVAGYAVYQGQQVFAALADRMQAVPQLSVRMFLDVQRGPGDTSTAAEVVQRFAHRFKSQQWPPDRPLPQVFYDARSLDLSADKRACLHAKCIVVDGESVFVSSANFTEAAQERNIEVGLLVRCRSLAERIAMHFEALLAAGLLVRAL